MLAQIDGRDQVLGNVLRLLEAARAAAARSLEALAFAGDAMFAATDEVCAALSASGRT